jgi:hypothetical protein
MLSRWLDWLAFGVLLSTGFSIALLHFDIAGLATRTLGSLAGDVMRIVLWALMALGFAPAVALTNALFRDPNDIRRP